MMLSFFKKNDGLTVALLTASCYVAAYFFEAGYARHAGIPMELISISLGNIVTTSIFLFFASVVAYFACTFPYILITRRFGDYKIAVVSSFVFSLVIFALLNIYLMGQLTIGVIVKSLCAWIILTLLFFLMINEKKDTVSSESDKPLTDKIHNITGTFFWLAFPCIFFILNCGIYSARMQDAFDSFTLNNNKYAILRIYGENIIAKKLIDKKMSGGIYIFKTDDFKAVEIIKQKGNSK
ncbi:hypothetical protein [Enterobacter bugandensis]|uniref:hypothetical protein n=2 Tax=Enterobacter bugandensis TaxID=881260 RepID=UPI0023628D23|nr:hypothetical protein [Enterobacter bugandensis]